MTYLGPNRHNRHRQCLIPAIKINFGHEHFICRLIYKIFDGPL